MADPPRNLDFEDAAAPGVPDGWVLEEVAQALEFVGWASAEFTPEPDPQMDGWSALGGVAGKTDPPYDPIASAVLGLSVQFTDDGALSAHGVFSPTGRALEEGRSYTFGVYLRSDSPAAYAGPLVAFCGDCALVAVYSFADGLLVHAGWASDGVHSDPAILSAVAASVSHVAGGDWVRVALSFTLAADASARGLEPESIYGALLMGDATGTTEYTGASEFLDLWGFHAYEGGLLAYEGYATVWTGGGYLSALESPAVATFPAASGVTGYDGYDRWTVPYLDDLTGYLTTASYSGAVPSAETYADGWGTDAYAEENAGVVFSTAGEGGVETYAVGWGTDLYVDALDGVGGAVSADWAGDLVLGAEAYWPAYPEVAYTAVPATDKLAAEAHGLANDVRVRLSNAGYAAGAAFPAPLSPHVSYYVVSSTADDFKLSTSVGGAAVDITSEGTGEQFVVPDPRRYWILE